MNDFQKSLDRYLTTEPEDGFTDWVERTIDNIPDGVYDKHSKWFDSPSGLCNELLQFMFVYGREPYEAAKVLTSLFQ